MIQMTLVEHNLNELAEHLYLMDKGVRNCFMMLLHGKDYYYDPYNDYNYLEDFVTSIVSRGFKYKFIEFDSDGEPFMDLFVYRYDHQFEMYKVSEILKRNNSRKVRRAGQYIMGKLLGYSDRNMEEYLNEIIHDGPTTVKVELEDDWLDGHYVKSLDVEEILGADDDDEDETVQESDKD